jgi:lipoate-protein ligase B
MATAMSWLFLGKNIQYEKALKIQNFLLTLKKTSSNVIPDVLLLLEHAPTYTAGRRGPLPSSSTDTFCQDKFEKQISLFKTLGADYYQVCVG